MTSDPLPSPADLFVTLKQWVEANSGSANPAGLSRMADLLTDALAGLPGELERIELPPVASDDGPPLQPGPALRLRFRPDAPIQVLFSGHMDTVYGPDSPFQRLEILPDGNWRGPGVSDMKGGLLVMIESLRRFLREDRSGRIGGELLITGDEETGSQASAPLLADAAARNHFGLVFEPAQGGSNLVSRRKGGGAFRLRAYGRAAHSGRDFAAGRNAVLAVAEAATVLHAINQFEPGIILNVARVRGGDALNVVPDYAQLDFHVRVDEPAQIPRVQAYLAAVVRHLQSLHPEIRAELSGGISRAPRIETSACQRLFGMWQTAEAASGQTPSGKQASGGASDGNLLAQYGLPHLDGIGVHGGNIHSDSEFVIPASIPRQIQVTTRFLHHVAEVGWAS